MAKGHIPKIQTINPVDELGVLTRLFRSERKSGPRMRLAAKISDMADKRCMTKEHCFLYLNRRVIEARLAARRQRYFARRFYNRVTGSRANAIDVTGAVLAVISDTLGHAHPDGLHRDGTYRVRLDISEELLDGFTRVMKSEGLLA